MKKFSLKQLDHNILWTPLLIIEIIGYILLVHQYSGATELSWLQSSLDNVVYQYYVLGNYPYSTLHQVSISPTTQIILLGIELLIFYILFNDKKISKHTNIRALVILLAVMILGIIYEKGSSSFGIAQIGVFISIVLMVKKPYLTLLEIFFTTLFIGIAGLFYIGSYLFLLVPLLYSLSQRKWFTYSIVNILAMITPAYLWVSYIWLMYDEWMYFPYIFSSWSWHIDIFANIYLSIALIVLIVLGYVYLLMRQLTGMNMAKQLSKLLVVYYFISLVLFFMETNNQIAISVMVPALAIVFIRNYKSK